MDGLKGQIAETILLPDFLREWQDEQEIKNFVYTISYEILNHYYKGVTVDWLQEKQIRRICRRIDTMSQDLSEVLPSDIYLQIWLWIGTTVENWIKFAVSCEEYEVATNLRKLLYSEYA